jgi:tripartite-type tricarboxylate transporter receptor subunit TctC
LVTGEGRQDDAGESARPDTQPTCACRRCIGGVCCCGWRTCRAAAQSTHPNKPIRLIVAYPAGACVDHGARGRRTILQSARSAGGDRQPSRRCCYAPARSRRKSAVRRLHAVAQPTGGLVSGRALMGSKIPCDPLKDFATIGLATYVPYALVVTASLPANSVKELIDLARASPRRLNVASASLGAAVRAARTSRA